MDLKQLRALLAVGELHSFSAAARALHTVQSNISTHIARLERELDVVLIDRASNELTEEGRLVADRARRIDGELAALVSDLAALRDVVTGNVRLGVIGTTARWLVPPLVEAAAARYPGVGFVVLDAPTSTLVPQLVDGHVDLAILSTPIHSTELVVEPLFDEDRLLVAPVGHPLYDRESVTIEELAHHELLLEAPGTSFRDQLETFAAAHGVELRAKAEVDGVRLLASLAFSGYGAAILPASAAPGWIGGDWRRVTIEGVDGRSVGLAQRRRGMPSAAHRAIASLTRDVIAAEAAKQPGVYPVSSVPAAG